MLQPPLARDRVEPLADGVQPPHHHDTVLAAHLPLDGGRRGEEAIPACPNAISSALSSNSLATRGRMSSLSNRRSAVLSVGSSMGAPPSECGKSRRQVRASAGVAKKVTPHSPSRWLKARTFVVDPIGASLST